MPTVIEDRLRKARKEHFCSFCGGKIFRGEQYRDQFNVYDGDAYHWKAHLSCQELANALKMYEDCWYDEGLTADNFHEYVSEYLHSREIPYGSWAEGLDKVKQLVLKGQENAS